MRVLGQQTPVMTSRSESYTSKTGISSVVTWSGAKEQMEELVAQLKNEKGTFGLIGNITSNFGTIPATVTVTYPSGDITGVNLGVGVVTTWQVAHEEITRPIEINPVFFNATTHVSRLGTDGEDAHKNILKIRKAIEDGSGMTLPFPAGELGALLKKYRDKLIEGTTHYAMVRYNVIKTQVRPLSMGLGALHTDMAILTKADVGMPEHIYNAIPGGYQFLAMGNDVTQADGRLTVTTTYSGADSWDSDLYQ